MNSWDILGIKPTDDMSVIKKAYAQKLKIFHPEDDPQGFQQLREAYDFALKYAKRKKDLNTNNSNINNSSYENQNLNIYYTDEATQNDDINSDNNSLYFNPIDINDLINKTSHINNLFDEFFKKAEEIYSDFNLRIDIKNWEVLLNYDIMWDINQRANLSERFLEFLYKHNLLPQNIWIYINNNFNWSDQEKLLYSNLPDYQIRLVINKLNYPYALEYKHLSFLPIKDIEQFLILRERALDNLLENQYSYMASNISMAKKIYDKDVDLLRLEGVYFFNNYRFDEALIYLNQALNINPADKASLLLRADLYYRQDKLEDSINDYLNIIKLCPEENEVYTKLASCHMKMKDYDTAREYLKKALKTNPTDINTRISLINVNKDIRNKLRKLIILNPLDNELKHNLRNTKNEIKILQKDIFKTKDSEKPLGKIYLKIAVIVIVMVSILFTLNKFVSDSNEKVTIESTKTTTADSTPVIDNKKIEIIYLNEANINNITSNTKVLAKFTSMQSLQTLWMVKKGTNEVQTTQFISALNIEESSHLNDFLMSIGTIGGKNILIVGASKNNVYNNSDKVYLQGTIRDIPSPDVIDVVKILVNKKQLYNINTYELITDKYILVDKKVNVPAQNNKSKTNNSYNYPVSTTSGGSDFPTGTAIIIVFIILYNLRKRF